MALVTVGSIPETNYSEYDDLMSMPHMYNSLNDDLSTGGIPLPDSISCHVNMSHNQFATLQMIYPREGLHQKEIQLNKWIMEDCDAKLVHQLFKITSIQSELDNIVVEAVHIDALLNDSTVPDPIQLTQVSAQDLGNQILNTMQEPRDFNFHSDVDDLSNVNIQGGQSAGSLFIDPDQEGDTATQSIIGLYKGEMRFDNFDIYHSKRIGTDSGIKIAYRKNISSATQNKNIQNMYTGAVFVATYTPGQAVATEDNVNWVAWQSDYSSVGITYMAGGSINVYDSPVEGQKIISSISNGMKLHLGKIVNDGSFTPDGKYQINTVNADAWYPIAPEDGGGWIDSKWINFDSTGAYAINGVTGDLTVQAGNPTESEGARSRVSASGYAVVAYKKGGVIHVYWAPDKGPDHYRRKNKDGSDMVKKNGQRIRYDMIERNSSGDLWYRIGPHKWLYGPHLSLSQDGSYRTYSNSGYGYIKKDAPKYHMNKKHEMVPITKTINAHGKNKKAWRYAGKGKKKQRIGNGSYWKEKKKKVKVTAKKGMTTIDKTISQGGKTYHHTKYGWVASGSIDYRKDGSVKPKSFESYIDNQIKDHSKVEIYATPDKTKALNWSIPNGESFHIDNGHEAKSGDGKTYIEVIYKGKTGWLCEDDINDKLSKINAVDADQDSDSDTDTNYNANVDQSQKEVRVKVGPIYAPGFGMNPNVDKVNTVDISSYFKHNDQDLSGQQPDGSFQPTDEDIKQAIKIGQNYLIEHRYGHIDVSMTLTYQQMSGINADFTQLSLYDYANVSFKPYGINEQVEVNATTWDCLAHAFISVTLGELPETYEHLLVQASEARTNEKVSRTRSAVNRVNSFVGAVNNALSLQGASQKQAWENLMVNLGDAHYTTDKKGKKHLVLDESIKAFAKHMTEMKTNVENFDNFLKNGTRATLHPVNASGEDTWQDPVAIVAQASDHSFEMNSDGIAFRDMYGNAHALFGWDASTGEARGNFFVDQAHIPVLDASHIETDTIHSLGTISGNLKVTNNPITVEIGNVENVTHYIQNDGQQGGIGISSPNHAVFIGSGYFGLDGNWMESSSANLYGMSLSNGTIYRTTNGKSEHVLWTSSTEDVMGRWIKDYWKGPAKYWKL